MVIVPHPPSHKVRHPPRPGTTHANYVCAGPGGRWAFGCNSLYFIPLRRVVRIHMCRWCLYTIRPLGRTLCMTRRDWTPGNWWLYRRTYSPLGTNCSRCPYNPLQQQPYPDGHDVDGSAAIAPIGTIARTNTTIRFIVAPPLVGK